MKVAVVGAGIAGLAAARSLSGRHELHVFDAAPRAGGHALTAEVEEGGRRFPVDMGFIVYNRRNYPGFCALLDELGVETVESSMGFSASDPATGFEYSGEGLSALFARRRNLLDPRFWGIVAGAWRFYRAGTRELAAGRHRSLAAFAQESRLPQSFVDLYLRPMAGAIWSMPVEQVLDFPAATLLTFFRQHGLLDLLDRPQWRTVRGGSRTYVAALTARLDATFHLGAPVRSIRRLDPGVEIAVAGETLRFDQVVLALHSDQALAALADPTPAEREVLGAIRYRASDVALHSDAALLPRRRRAWASWNVRLDGAESLGVTYLMNLLQPLPTETPWCVTLNRTAAIDPARLCRQEEMAHPQFDAAAVAAQERWEEISGRRSTHYGGAYWRYGFHEDGLWSGRRAAEAVAQTAARAA
ncbi:MAG TPA: FAD-dependent oxidoreductase [Acidobacteria bacterium]|nr:FAD-dependent oxidoreductase [Acidobacteriota bacterium]